MCLTSQLTILQVFLVVSTEVKTRWGCRWWSWESYGAVWPAAAGPRRGGMQTWGVCVEWSSAAVRNGLCHCPWRKVWDDPDRTLGWWLALPLSSLPSALYAHSLPPSFTLLINFSLCWLLKPQLPDVSASAHAVWLIFFLPVVSLSSSKVYAAITVPVVL